MEHRTKRGSVAITQDDWLGALRDLGVEETTNDPNALTVRQLAALWKMSECQARHHVNKLVANKTARRIQTQRSDDGVPRRVYAYLLVKT